MLHDGAVKKPFVILLDLQMPRMNGLEFLSAIRTDPDYADSVIFVLTTSKSEEGLTSAYHNQIAGYFIKEQTGNSFPGVVEMLDGYWKIAYLPNE